MEEEGRGLLQVTTCWAGAGFKTGDCTCGQGRGFSQVALPDVITDSTEPTLKASSFQNDVKKQRRRCNKGFFSSLMFSANAFYTMTWLRRVVAHFNEIC